MVRSDEKEPALPLLELMDQGRNYQGRRCRGDADHPGTNTGPLRGAEDAGATDYVWMPAEEEAEERLLEEILHPWHAAYAEWVREERAHPELQEWMELEEL